MKKLLIFGFLLTGHAYSFCVPQEIASKLNCEILRGSECINDYGVGIPVSEKNACTAKNVVALLKKTVPSNILARVKSESDEIDTIITMIDRKGLESKVFDFKIVEVKTFQESHINSLLSKMTELRESIYKLSISVNIIDSDLGKQAVIYATRYYSFMARIHQIMASSAHSQEKHNLDYDLLKKFTLKVDKRIGLEILSKMNLKARHLDSETLKFIVSEEEKQGYEFNVIQSPHSLNHYAKLVQFMSIRELLTNRWALKRISTQTFDNPKVKYCGPQMLSFRPGADMTMGNSSIAKELDSFDMYFTQYPKIISGLVNASKKVSLLTHDGSKALVEKVFKEISAFITVLKDDYGWTDEEITSWKSEIATILKENEDSEWSNYAENILMVSVFSDDKLSSSHLETRIIEDIYNLRKDAIVVQMKAIMEDLPSPEKNRIQKVVNTVLDSNRLAWVELMKPVVRPIVVGVDDHSKFKSQNYLDKVSQTKEIASNALSAAYLQQYIISRNLKKKLNSKKINVRDLEPKSPTELIEYFQSKLSANIALNYYVDSDESKRRIITSFFENITKNFDGLSAKLSVGEIQGKLFEIAYKQSLELKNQYKTSSSTWKPVVTKAPSPSTTPARIPVKRFDYNPPAYGSDNTKVSHTRPSFISISSDDKKGVLPGELTGKKSDVAPEILKEQMSEKIRSSYNTLSMLRFQPTVNDNTRVQANKRMINFKGENLPTSKKYLIPAEELSRLSNTAEFVKTFLSTLNLEANEKSFLLTLNDQSIMADIRLAAAYNSATLLKTPITRSEKKMSTTSRVAYETTVKVDKPAIIRMLEAFKLSADGSHIVNDVALVGIIKETISKAILNHNGTTVALCHADFTNPENDDHFKTLFRSSTFIRQGILSNEALTEEVANRLKFYDGQLKKHTRYWHEAISEDWIEPMMNVAMVVFIVSAVIIPILGSGGVLAPGTMMLLMTMLDGFDLAVTGASLYFRSMSTFYEVPAQLKFQKALAYSQIDNFSLTTWDDVSDSEKSSKMMKSMMIAFSPLEAIVGGQLYYSAKRLLGVSGKQALKRVGLPARGFGAVPRNIVPKITYKQMISKKGLVKGTISKVGQDISNLKYWTPRYQPITDSEIANTLRTGIVAKAKLLVVHSSGSSSSLANKPWLMIDEFKHEINRISTRLEINTIVDEVTGKELGQAAMKGKMSFKEFINKPSYAMEWMVPKTMIAAAKRGRLLDYLENWDNVIESMSRLRGKLLVKRKATINTMLSKLEEVEKLAQINPTYLTTSGRDNWMDYYQSLLSAEEIKAFRDITKTSLAGSNISQFKTVFKDHETILETIVPFTTVHGRVMTKLAGAYGKIASSVDEKIDLKESYIDMLDNDGSIHINDPEIMDTRTDIENALD